MSDASAVVGAFFDRLREGDLEGFLALWARDAVMEMPFAAPGLPTGFRGLDELELFWRTVFAEMAEVDFEGLEIEALARPGWWMSRQEGRIRLADGRPYDNRYICLFEVRDGVITAYHEYYNPLLVVGAFGDADAVAGRFTA